jgi:RNA polymerase subunit RPABC4/transcription elongation factor Spt4
MSNTQKFNEAKERLITSAQRVAGAYMLSKYGSAHFSGEPKVELTSTEGPTNSSFVFSGSITCFAGDGLLNQVGVNMTVNENDIEVTSEDIQANISDALNAAEDQPEHVVASLDGFKLQDDGTIYLKVSHKAVQSPVLGIVGKNEYATSKDRAALLQGILKDAFLETPVTFEGEFKEPTIEKAAAEEKGDSKSCKECGYSFKSHQDKCPYCEGGRKAEASLKGTKKSWLTAGFDAVPEMSDEQLDENSMYQDHVKCNNCEWDGMVGRNSESCPGCGANGMLMDIEQDVEAAKPTMGIREDMPMARAHDSMSHMAQFEEQSDLAAQMKVEHEAANSLMSMLQGMGYGTAKTVEITSSKDGFDIMTAIDDAGAVKAVSIPVTVKEGKVVLPKKALISTLISKGLDIQARLAEQFDLEVVKKLAAIEEKIAYEAKEANDILAEMPVTKTANEGKNTMFEGDTDTLTVQKHLLPNHEKMKVGDKISDGSDQWELVNTGGQQNSKGEDDGSLWTMKKCQSPARSDEEPKNTMPI